MYYWSYQLAGETSSRKALSYVTGWFWLIGNWTIALSVNFGFASLIAATISICNPDWTASEWQLLLMFYAICIFVFLVVALGDRMLPYIDAAAAIWNLVTIVAVLIALASTAKQGRHSASFALSNYETSFSGWGQGFTFFIGMVSLFALPQPELTHRSRTTPSSLRVQCHWYGDLYGRRMRES